MPNIGIMETRDRYGRTKLHMAVQMGMIMPVREHLRQGFDVHARDNAGKTPLDYAKRANNDRLVGILEDAARKRDMSRLAGMKRGAPGPSDLKRGVGKPKKRKV
ncbi:MAG: hypothetical protein ABIH76_05115, partial [Candidatus Bathyarchaeota archaeon]